MKIGLEIAINSLIPSANFILRGLELEHLEWNDERQKPSNADITKEQERLQVLEDERVAREANKKQGETYTLNGVDYKIPFMKDDADGVMQVSNAFQLGITGTVIYFTNGTKMPITTVEFQEFVIWFVTRRNEFFKQRS